jgi:hypothetical protein
LFFGILVAAHVFLFLRNSSSPAEIVSCRQFREIRKMSWDARPKKTGNHPIDPCGKAVECRRSRNLSDGAWEIPGGRQAGDTEPGKREDRFRLGSAPDGSGAGAESSAEDRRLCGNR